jgi:hypothetical protein
LGDWSRGIQEEFSDPGLFSFAETSTAVAYIDTRSQFQQPMAIAYATEFAAPRTMQDAIDATKDETELDAVNFELVAESRFGADYPFVIFRQFINNDVGSPTYLHWGYKDSHCMFTTSAAIPIDLENLTMSIVESILNSEQSCRA